MRRTHAQSNHRWCIGDDRRQHRQALFRSARTGARSISVDTHAVHQAPGIAAYHGARPSIAQDTPSTSILSACAAAVGKILRAGNRSVHPGRENAGLWIAIRNPPCDAIRVLISRHSTREVAEETSQADSAAKIAARPTSERREGEWERLVFETCKVQYVPMPVAGQSPSGA